MIRIVLVDDQALVRTGLRMVLEAEPDIEVVGEAADGRQALEAARLAPDLFLMDVRMPNVDEYVFTALRAGACGFLLKHTPPEGLVSAVRTVASGDGLIAPAVTRRLIAEFARAPATPAPPPELARLTDREREVLELVARGRSNAEIARDLVVGPATVKTHVGRVLTKLGLRGRVEAVIWAYEAGLVQPGRSR